MLQQCKCAICKTQVSGFHLNPLLQTLNNQHVTRNENKIEIKHNQKHKNMHQHQSHRIYGLQITKIKVHRFKHKTLTKPR